jgi:hypothetical protein
MLAAVVASGSSYCRSFLFSTIFASCLGVSRERSERDGSSERVLMVKRWKNGRPELSVVEGVLVGEFVDALADSSDNAVLVG